LNNTFKMIQAERDHFARIEDVLGTVNLFFKPLIEQLQQEDLSKVNLSQLKLELKHYSYGYVVRAK